MTDPRTLMPTAEPFIVADPDNNHGFYFCATRLYHGSWRDGDNVDYSASNQLFTVVIWGKTRDQFDYAPETLKGEPICVKGMIEQYKSKPQIVVDSPSQIMLDKSSVTNFI